MTEADFRALVELAREAADRTRRLQALTAALAGALDKRQVISTFVAAGRSALGASVGLAWLLTDEHTLELVDGNDDGQPEPVDDFRTIPLLSCIPVCDVTRDAKPLMFESRAALAASYPGENTSPFHAWAVLPFVIGGRGVGAASFSFEHERAFSEDDREMLVAMSGQASLALERARLIEAYRRSDEQLRSALATAQLVGSFTTVLDHDRLVQLMTDELVMLVGADAGVFRADARDPHVKRVEHPSYLGVPVISLTGDVYGTFAFSHPEGGRFTDEHARVVGAVASQAAVALENARLYKSVREHKEQLEAAFERARLADRRKDEFLAMLGHELRNPLAPISTALELMEMHGLPALHRERDVIRRQVTHLSRLIDDLLDVSRITRGKLELAREPLELSGVIAKAIELASPLLEKRRHHLRVDVPRALIVDADPRRLAQVFQNLIANAAQYSKVGSVIEIEACTDDELVRVAVRDHGAGIAPDMLASLFEPFVQGPRTIDRAAGGLGIGLAIAKSLCELHGGTIEVASDGAGTGSTFTVTLPRASHATTPLAERAAPKLGAGTRILVVDDNIDAAFMLRELLRIVGHEPAVAHDGPSALELARTFDPQVAVLDIGLPVMNGYELARQLREHFGTERLRLIALTGYGQDTDRERAKEVGFDHHMIKPVELDKLLALLAKPE